MKAAGIWRRLFAHILDYFIILLIVVAFYFIIALFSLNPITFTLTPPVIIILLTFPFSYYVILKSSEKHASFGKRFMEIKVVTSDSSKLSVSRTMLRTLLYLLPFLAIFWYLPIFSHKSTIYDLLSNTRVISN
jgi:uncharacterized RDD family membrane protein YckC